MAIILNNEKLFTIRAVVGDVLQDPLFILAGSADEADAAVFLHFGSIEKFNGQPIRIIAVNVTNPKTIYGNPS